MEDCEVLDSCEYVMKNAGDVHINESSVTSLAQSLSREKFEIPPWNRELHFSNGEEKTLMYALVLDTLNFCFWSDPGLPRWRVTTHEGKDYNGYWALAISLKKAFLSEDFPLWDAHYLKMIPPGDLSIILRGSAGTAIPLFTERLLNLREVGDILVKDYNGTFAEMVEDCGGDAVSLVRSVAGHFSSYADEAEYKKRKIYFYKRAQILVSDIAAIFSGKRWGKFHNLERLTAFADYKIPQVLRELGVLEYSEKLSQIVDARHFVEAGSPQEVEIRAATIWAIELLRRALDEAGKSRKAVELDWMLWQWGQENVPGARPYHLTRTIYY